MATNNNTTTANRVASYVIVFTVDLSSPASLSSPNPNGNQTEANMAAQRSTWIPQEFRHRHENRVFHHGDTITAYDDNAYYLRQKYEKTASNPNGILTVVSETL